MSRETTDGFRLRKGDKDAKERYDRLRHRRIGETRYMEPRIIETLGLKDTVDTMLDNIGITDLVSTALPTYRRFTLELMCSIKVDTKHHTEDHGKVSFRLLNKEHTYTLEQFATILGVPSGGRREKPKEFDYHNTWEMLTTTETKYCPGSAKVSRIFNPAIRYAHRLLSSIIFPRGDSKGVLRTDEFLAIWCMLYAHPYDTAYHVAKHLETQAGRGLGPIQCGGLVSKIMQGIGTRIPRDTLAIPAAYMDLSYILSFRLLERRGRQLWVLYQGQTYFRLPDPERVAIFSEAPKISIPTLPDNYIEDPPGVVDPFAEFPGGDAHVVQCSDIGQTETGAEQPKSFTHRTAHRVVCQQPVPQPTPQSADSERLTRMEAQLTTLQGEPVPQPTPQSADSERLARMEAQLTTMQGEFHTFQESVTTLQAEFHTFREFATPILQLWYESQIPPTPSPMLHDLPQQD